MIGFAEKTQVTKAFLPQSKEMEATNPSKNQVKTRSAKGTQGTSIHAAEQGRTEATK